MSTTTLKVHNDSLSTLDKSSTYFDKQQFPPRMYASLFCYDIYLSNDMLHDKECYSKIKFWKAEQYF